MACPEHVREYGGRKERLGITEHPLLFEQFQRQMRCDRQRHTAHDRSWTGPERRGALSCQGPHSWQGFNVRGRARKDVEPSICYLNISESLGAYPTRKIWKEHRIPSTETIWWLIWGSEGLMGEQWRVVHARMSGDEEENQKWKLWPWSIQRDPELGDCTFDVRIPVRGTSLSISTGIHDAVDRNMAGKTQIQILSPNPSGGSLSWKCQPPWSGEIDMCLLTQKVRTKERNEGVRQAQKLTH